MDYKVVHPSWVKDQDEPCNQEAWELEDGWDEDSPPANDQEDSEVTLGDALVSPRTEVQPWGIRDAKWHWQIIEGYPKDILFAKILDNPEDYKAFWVAKDLI